MPQAGRGSSSRTPSYREDIRHPPTRLPPTRHSPTRHPGEIRSDFDLRLGRHITLQGSARITPAGIVSAGIAVAAMTLALGYLAVSLGRLRR